MHFMLRYASITKPGNRSLNEDSVGAFKKENNHCFVVCDGLGGHGMGDIASNLVKSVFEMRFLCSNDMSQYLGQAFTAAQDVLLAEQIKRNANKKMKTTAAAMAADEKNVYIGHIGDSRIYVFGKGKVKTRTLDHSIPQMLVLSKEIKENEIRNHPDRNIVLRVMGVEWEEPMYELMKPIPLRKCQAFLLCTDGFWELIDEKDMCSTLEKSISPEQWIVNMSEIVEKNGVGRNMDNYSAIAVFNIRR